MIWRVYLKLCQNIRLVPLGYAETLVTQLLAGEFEEDIVQSRADDLSRGLVFDEFFEFGVGAARDDFTPVKDDDAVAELLDFFHIMGGIDDGGAALS